MTKKQVNDKMKVSIFDRIERSSFMFVLFTDTDTDVTLELAKELGYHLISMPYSILGKDFYPCEDEGYDYKEYYNLLRKGIVPKTFGLSSEKYKAYFEPFLAEGKDILYVHFSKAMSGTFNAMHIAIEELKELYPNQTVYTIDTKAITIGSYPLLREISVLYKENKTVEEIIEWATVERDHFATYFYADDLKFFGKSGRVSNLAAIMGTIFGIHPIINMDEKGVMNALTKTRGRMGSLKKIVDYVVELADDIENHPIVIGHTDALEMAKKLGEMLKSRLNKELDIEYILVNPTAGAHCGPDTVGVSFHAKHR